MSSSIHILIILAGVFLVAVLLNVYMLRENFSSFNITKLTVVKDESGNTVGTSESSENSPLIDPNGNLVEVSPSGVPVDNKGNPVLRDVYGNYLSVDAEGNVIIKDAPEIQISDNVSSPSLKQGNTFSQLIKQLVSGSSTKKNGDLSLSDDSGKLEKPEIPVDITPGSQSNNILNYSLDQASQQPTTTANPIVNPDTPFLQQGADYSGNSGINKASSAYAVAQQEARRAEPCPVDLNDYIRKDSIPCYACTLK
jgi:hypothetical protein